MNRQIGYYLAKIIGKMKHDKHKETLNRWFIQQGVKLETIGGMDQY